MNKKTLNTFVGVIGAALFVVVIVAGVMWASKNSTTKKSSDADKLQVVASFYPLYFFAHEIGGEEVDVSNVTPAGAEPHEYEPKPSDIARIEKADILILNGGGLEPWAENVQKNIDPNQTTIVEAGQGLVDRDLIEDGQKIQDPHIWLSPVLAQKMVDRISTSFIKADPKNAAIYEANARELAQKLDNLNQRFAYVLRACMFKNIVTSHAAFGYLAAEYGLNQVAIAGLSPESEPSAKQLAEIVKFAKDNHVSFIFFESLVSPKLSQTIATEVGAQTLVLNPIEGLSDDEVKAGKDYFSEMYANLSNLQYALSCVK